MVLIKPPWTRTRNHRNSLILAGIKMFLFSRFYYLRGPCFIILFHLSQSKRDTAIPSFSSGRFYKDHPLYASKSSVTVKWLVDIDCLTLVRLIVRCLIWSKSNSEKTRHSPECIQILAFVSEMSDIHSSIWEITNLGGSQVRKCASDMWIFAKIVLWCCWKAFYASVRGIG